ncbi:protein GVQW3-like, partial [Stegodyphus dumicola]|uniref:protein GVQW3-like n=1 Tax=Stegodyphus dumicola TaxID=202533 RepID=UPI0015B056AF
MDEFQEEPEVPVAAAQNPEMPAAALERIPQDAGNRSKNYRMLLYKQQYQGIKISSVRTWYRKIEQRADIVKKGLKAMEIHTEMVNVLGESAPSKTMVCKWANLFKSGRTSLEDDPREGRPKTASTPEIIRKIQDMVLEDRRLTERDLTDSLGILLGTVSNILSVNLGFKKLCAKWVLHSLTMEQKHIRMRLCQQHLERFKKNKSDFIRRFITLDETWVYHHDPESKQEAKEWCEPGSSAPKRVRVQKSAKK